MRNLLKLMLVVIAAYLTSCKENEEDIKKEKLNFLFLTCEDISPTLSMYGDSTAKTPHLDKLAEESMIFTNAFTTTGVCSPSRSAIITGMYPTSIGTHNMRTGKDIVGWGARSYDEKHEAFDINKDRVPLYSAVLPEYVKCFTEYLRKAGYYCANNYKTDYQFAAPVTAWDANNPIAHWKNRNSGQPFFAVFNDNITHESKIWVNDTLDLTIDPNSVPVPPYLPDNKITRKDVARNYSNIELMDKHVGEKLKELTEAGLLDKTVIFWFSDHGGPLPKGKREYTDDGLKVPFLVRLPNGKGAGYVEDLISFVDIAPTILSLAEIQIPEYMQGQAFLGKQKSIKTRKYIFGSGDRFDEFADRCRTIRDDRYLFIKNFHPELPAYKDVGYRKNIKTMQEMLKLKKTGDLNEKQRYWFRVTKAEEELYDIQSDPHCLNNLITSSEHTKKITELRTALINWIKEVGDIGAIPEKELYLSWWADGIQPITAEPEIKVVNKKISLNCKTKGASIAFIISDKRFEPDLDSGWQLYHSPFSIKKGQFLYVLANRIGYKDSKVLVYTYTDLQNM